jgi:hypothetical protein
MTPLNRTEFSDALQKGKGRVVLYLREYGAAESQDEILQACLHNLTYDAQSEGSRAEWLMSLIDISSNEDFFRKPILEALTHSTDIWEVNQLMNLALAFARRGFSEGRRVIYEKFDKQEFDESWLGGKQIMTMDGVMGMLHVAEVIGKRMVRNPEFWEDGLFSEACHRLGKEVMMTAFQEHAEKSVNVKAYLDTATKGRTGNYPSPRGIQTLEKILEDIEAASGEYPGHYVQFGKRADAKDLDVVFARLLSEARRDQLLRCLWVFLRRAMPILDTRLLQLAESEDEKLQRAAIVALAQMQDPSIRVLAIRLLGEHPKVITREAITLFNRNYVSGDHEVIENALFVPEDKETTHNIGYGILALTKSQKGAELTKLLEWVYENTPCSICRRNALKGLLERNRASDSMLVESVWDCCEETRTLAKNAMG